MGVSVPSKNHSTSLLKNRIHPQSCSDTSRYTLAQPVHQTRAQVRTVTLPKTQALPQPCRGFRHPFQSSTCKAVCNATTYRDYQINDGQVWITRSGSLSIKALWRHRHKPQGKARLVYGVTTKLLQVAATVHGPYFLCMGGTQLSSSSHCSFTTFGGGIKMHLLGGCWGGSSATASSTAARVTCILLLPASNPLQPSFHEYVSFLCVYIAHILQMLFLCVKYTSVSSLLTFCMSELTAGACWPLVITTRFGKRPSGWAEDAATSWESYSPYRLDTCSLYFLLLFHKAGTAPQGLLTTTVTETGSRHMPLISKNCWISSANLLCKDQCLPGMGQTTPFPWASGQMTQQGLKTSKELENETSTLIPLQI